MKSFIRRAKPEDCFGLHVAHMRSIREICSSHYSPREIAAWTDRNYRPEHLEEAMKRDFVWVVEESEGIKGFAHFAVMSQSEGEVLGLYLTPDVSRQGLGKLLFAEIIAIARQHSLDKICLHATKNAKRFYETLGFFQSGSDSSVEMRGVPIPCFPMELILEKP